MIKTEEISSPQSCLNKANPHEALFVLLARDAAAPDAIQAWVKARIRLGKNVVMDDQIQEALKCSDLMEQQLKSGVLSTAAAQPLPEYTAEVSRQTWLPFAPTHRHAEGGLYQVIGNMLKVHIGGKWLTAVSYRNAAGETFVRSLDDFDERMTPIVRTEWEGYPGIAHDLETTRTLLAETRKTKSEADELLRRFEVWRTGPEGPEVLFKEGAQLYSDIKKYLGSK